MLDSGNRILADLQQHAVRCRWIHQKMKPASGPDLDFLGDQPHAGLLHLLESARNVVHVERQVVQAFPMLRQKLA